MKPSEPYRGADLIVDLLEQQGVRVVAGIPGGALLPLYDALGRSTLIRHVLARHEQAAGFIAQGMARVSGTAGVCLATSGPGVTNVITALADAKMDSVPLVCIAGQVPTSLLGTDAFQEVPTMELARPITKASFFVTDATELGGVVRQAFRIAQRGRPGPVLIDVPKDVQLQPCEPAPEPADITQCTDGAARQRCTSSAAHGKLFDRACELISAAQRPILYVGGGVVKARAHLLVRALAERAEIPVAATLMALGTLPREHRLYLGMLGMHGARFTNMAIDECDLLLAVGARFDDRATGRPDQFAPHARIIHIDIDARELGKIKQPYLAIQADAAEALAALLDRVPPGRRTPWLARIEQLRASHPLHTPQAYELCSPYGIVRAVGELAPEDCIVTTDVGQHQMWVAQRYAFRRPDRWLTSGGLGTMGFGLPTAIGALLAEPAAGAICFTGDGSLLMNIQELATLAELDLDVKVILFDNAALGLVRQQQDLFFGRRHVASKFVQPSRFVAIARAFGIAAFDLEESIDPHATLAQALRARGPVLVRVPIGADQHVLPIVAPGAGNTQALDHASAMERLFID